MKKINLSGYFLRRGTASLCKIIAVTLVILWFQIGCAKNAQFNKLVPAEIDIAGIQRVAVADFDGLEQSGKIVAAKIAEGIVDAGYYKLFEREKLSRIIEEREFSQSNVVDPTTVSQLKLMGVYALIFGVVDAYSIDEQTGVTKICTLNSDRTLKKPRFYTGNRETISKTASLARWGNSPPPSPRIRGEERGSGGWASSGFRFNLLKSRSSSPGGNYHGKLLFT